MLEWAAVGQDPCLCLVHSHLHCSIFLELLNAVAVSEVALPGSDVAVTSSNYSGCQKSYFQQPYVL